jgi:hypothetical protein
VKFTRPATLGEGEARAAFAQWLADVEARIAMLWAEVRDEGVDLTHRQAHALAGRWYRWKTDRHGEDPGSPERWTNEIGALITTLDEFADDARKTGLSAPIALKPLPDLAAPGLRFIDLIDQLTTTQARVLDRISAAAEAPAFLARERIALSGDGRRRFLGALLDEMVAAAALLHRRARGDYTPDPHPAKFPEWRPPAASAKTTVRGAFSPMALYRAWAKANETRTSASTRNRWITVFRDLERFSEGADVSSFAEDDALRWRDQLRAANRSEKTVNFQYIAAAKVVFGWAARPRTDDGGALIATNPFANFRMGARNGARKTVKLRERSFRLEEMGLILPAAQRISASQEAGGLTRAKRWAPWLLAYSGARPGEVCQLRREDCGRCRGDGRSGSRPRLERSRIARRGSSRCIATGAVRPTLPSLCEGPWLLASGRPQ